MKDFIYNNIKNSELYVSTEIINSIIEALKKEILRNKETFLELQEIDSKHSAQVVNISTMLNILEAYKNKKTIEISEKEIILATYYGNPYITINLLMHSLYMKKAVIISIEDEMLGINKLLVNLFNSVLKNYKITEMVKLCNMLPEEEIIENQLNIRDIICIGNYETYKKLRRNNIENLRYMPFRNMVVFSEKDKYSELQYKLYQYATTNGIEIEVYDDIEVSEFIECMEMDNTIENVVVFTENDKTINDLRDNLKSVKLFINENPFKDEKFILDLIVNN